MKKLIISLLVVILVLILGGVFLYSRPIENNEITNEVIEPEITEPVSNEGLEEIDAEVIKKEYTDFALLECISEEENYMVSPLSLKMALLMAANGAEGKTQKEMLDIFKVEDIKKYNEEINDLIESYNTKETVELNLANSIWLNKDAAYDIIFDQEFANLISEYYEGVANEVTNEDALIKINTWVEEKTNGKIKNLLDNTDFLGALINTLYFKGSWANEFSEELTETDEFTNINGKKTEKEFMNKTSRYNYYEDGTMQMVRIPYRDKDIAMYIALPKGEETLDFTSALENMQNKKINLTIPKFKVEYKIELNDILKEFGMRTAFSENAEFGKMFKAKDGADFYISKVLQQTFIEIDEKGTEAAAATAVLMNLTSARPMPEETIDFVANRPFIYFIRDDANNEILFLGKIVM